MPAFSVFIIFSNARNFPFIYEIVMFPEQCTLVYYRHRIYIPTLSRADSSLEEDKVFLGGELEVLEVGCSKAGGQLQYSWRSAAVSWMSAAIMLEVSSSKTGDQLQ
jgi:hypothetical protein